MTPGPVISRRGAASRHFDPDPVNAYIFLLSNRSFA